MNFEPNLETPKNNHLSNDEKEAFANEHASNMEEKYNNRESIHIDLILNLSETINDLEKQLRELPETNENNQKKLSLEEQKSKASSNIEATLQIISPVNLEKLKMISKENNPSE
ncbi:MAG: hypothetical protein ACI870_000021 [Crocinitomicaceae bacterium]|jgi:hypothetical protein